MADPLQRLLEAGGAVDLSAHAKFRLSGGDRVRYLNGQVSNDVVGLGSDRAIAACVATVKGRLQGLVRICAPEGAEAFWIEAPTELRESLLARLGRYIIADDAELDDVTEEFGLVHVFGAAAKGVTLGSADGRSFSCERFGLPGRDVWLPADTPRTFDFLESEALERLRIYQGVPVWGAELGEDVFPAEAHLDRSAVDFHKGCYVGQEVISRIESVGHVNRILVGLRAPSEVAVGTALALEGEETEIGRVTSGLVDDEGWIGLGFVRTAHSGVGTRLHSLAGPENKLSCELDIRETPLYLGK